MKTILVLGLVAIMGLLAVGIAIPAFAESTDDAGTPSTTQNAWDKMREACQTGDWEAMTEAAKGVRGTGGGCCILNAPDDQSAPITPNGNTNGTGSPQRGGGCH